ncbi:MAG: 4-hydroxythreonine-4-phosphate dehydrogenase PdxA [Planctomycetota bacterium]
MSEASFPVKDEESPSHRALTPRLAICVGDAAGVGIEVTLRALSELPANAAEIVLYGPEAVIRRVAELPSMAPFSGPGLSRVHGWCDFEVKLENWSMGKFDAVTGQASFDAFDHAINDAIAGDVDAIVTGPIQKEAWAMAGINFPGHTEVLADRTGTSNFCMMLASESIRCSLVTIHMPLADVARALTAEAIERTIRVTVDSIRTLPKVSTPVRLTVCGFNPHAGERGLFSHGEEEKLIGPAIKSCSDLDAIITGPVPPDTAFIRSMRDQTDAYICMYHDQGLIPMKALAFDEGINVTLGLPIIRTSVDHGTALEIAGQGIANHQSMASAIRYAIEMASVR